MLSPVLPRAVRRLSGTLALAGAVAIAASSTPAQQLYQLAPSNGGADLVYIDFLAVDRQGLPVLDLRPDEVVLRVDGRPRAVASLQLVDFSGASGESPTLAGDGLPAPFGSNVINPSRSVVILIDDDSIRPGRERATLAAVDELMTSLPPRTRIAIATPHGGWKTRLTMDRAEVRRVLSEIVGRAFDTDDVECRTRVTLGAVQTALAPFAAEAAPTILVISGGLAGPRQNIPEGGRGLARAAGVPQARPCDLRIEDFLKVSETAANARAHLYVIQPDDAAPASNMGQLSVTPADLTSGLTTLAGVAGGKLLHLTPSSPNPLIAAEREASAYYVLAFEPTAAEGTRSTHRIDVRVVRANISVTRRPQVTLEKPAARPLTPAATTAVAMLLDPSTRRELPLRTAGYASRNSDPSASVRIIVFAEPLEPAAAFASAAAGLFDPRGRLVSQWTSTVAGLSPGPILAALSAPPGTYRLRFAALNAAGRAGTADYFVDATLEPAGTLKLSALMLGILNNNRLTPALEFTTEAAVASLEIYGDRQEKPIAATLEVAQSVNGAALLTVPLLVAPTSDADRFVATASIPIASLTAGDYVVRVTVNLQGQPQGRVVRTLRKR